MTRPRKVPRQLAAATHGSGPSLSSPHLAISKDSVADPCRIRVKGFRSPRFREQLHPHLESTFELPGFKDFKPEAKSISNPGPQTKIFDYPLVR